MLLDAVLFLIDGLVWVGSFLASGLRFLASPRYRERTLRRWREERSSEVALEVSGWLVGFGLSLGLVAWLTLAILRRLGFHAP